LPTYENISREFGYPETSFIYYSKTDKALRVRSFTPTGFEVKGAGHHLLGAVYAALLTNVEIFHEQQEKQFVIMKDEAIFLSVDYADNNLLFIGMMQKPAIIEALVDPVIIADAITLNPDEISAGDLVPTVVKTEVAHLMVPVKDVEILNKAISDKSLLKKLADAYKFEGVYCFAILNEDSQYIAQARFFNPGIGIDEDAATGSVAGPLAGLLLQKRYICKDIEYQILQGAKMNQPAVIRFKVKKEGIWISGTSVVVMEGTIYE
jgi:PhzF family phenazine biosynthesis protein